MTNTLPDSRRATDVDADSPFRPTALELPKGLPFKRWGTIGATLDTMAKGVNWWIGDWVNYGDREYGEKYTQAIEETGRDPQSLADLAWVANRIEPSRRRENLTWSHHREVAPLEPETADRLLELAEAEGWSVRRLRDEVKALRRRINPDGSSDDPTESAPPGDADFTSDDVRSQLLDELEASHERIRRMQAELDSLRATDQGAVIAQLHDRIERLEGRVNQALNESAEKERLLRSYRRLLDEARKVLGIGPGDDLLAALRELLR